MHEMGIANSVLESIRTEAQRFPGRHIYKVGVRIGELAGVDPEAMRFCFEALVRDTDLEPLALEIDYRPRRHECQTLRTILCTAARRLEVCELWRSGFTIYRRRRTGTRLPGG